MRLFDGSAEYVRLDEVAPGDTVKEEGSWREVAPRGMECDGLKVYLTFTDGFSSEGAATERILRKIEEGTS